MGGHVALASSLLAPWWLGHLITIAVHGGPASRCSLSAWLPARQPGLLRQRRASASAGLYMRHKRNLCVRPPALPVDMMVGAATVHCCLVAADIS
jgi:hypothetical protein